MRKKKQTKIIAFKNNDVLFKSVNPLGEDLTIDKVKILLKNDSISDEEANHIIYSITIFAEIICNFAKALQYYPESIEIIKEISDENISKKAA